MPQSPNRLQNDLNYVKCDVKPNYTLTRWSSLVELYSGPAEQSSHHLQTSDEGTPFSGSTNTALC